MLQKAREAVNVSPPNQHPNEASEPTIAQTKQNFHEIGLRGCFNSVAGCVNKTHQACQRRDKSWPSGFSQFTRLMKTQGRNIYRNLFGFFNAYQLIMSFRLSFDNTFLPVLFQDFRNVKHFTNIIMHFTRKCSWHNCVTEIPNNDQ